MVKNTACMNRHFENFGREAQIDEATFQGEVGSTESQAAMLAEAPASAEADVAAFQPEATEAAPETDVAASEPEATAAAPEESPPAEAPAPAEDGVAPQA